MIINAPIHYQGIIIDGQCYLADNTRYNQPNYRRDALRKDPCWCCFGAGGHLEHLQPHYWHNKKKKGGPHAWWNLAGSCESCNNARGTMPLLRYLLRR